MTKNQEKQDIREYIAQMIYEQYQESLKALNEYYPKGRQEIDELEQRFTTAKSPLVSRLVGLEWVLRAFELEARCSRTLTLNNLHLVAEAAAMAAREPKPTQAEQDELKQQVEAAKKDLAEYALGRKKELDEDLARRIAKVAKLFDSKGHEAMYGASRGD
jgi:chromosome segregation ATPase